MATAKRREGRCGLAQSPARTPIALANRAPREPLSETSAAEHDGCPWRNPRPAAALSSAYAAIRCAEWRTACRHAAFHSRRRRCRAAARLESDGAYRCRSGPRGPSASAQRGAAADADGMAAQREQQAEAFALLRPATAVATSAPPPTDGVLMVGRGVTSERSAEPGKLLPSPGRRSALASCSPQVPAL